MDKLIENEQQQRANPEAYARDMWVRQNAESLPPGSRVLDAGAGASKYRPFFKHCRYETQDFCQYEGELVQYLQPIDHVCDIIAIPLADGVLDAIICTEVFEHVVDPMAVLKEFARLLKPGGKLWVTAPFLSSMHMEPFHFYSGFTRYWYQHWLPLHGFEIESITPIGGPARTSVVYAQAFYENWSRAERSLGTIKKSISKAFRLPAKILVHYVLPRLLPEMDQWLGAQKVCSGYMVSAVRKLEISDLKGTSIP